MLGLLFVAWGTFKIVEALDRLACVHDGQTLDACIEAQEADDE